MDALDLDPAGYTGTYKLIAGRSSLNLVNTISWPGTDRHHDWLSSTANLRRWAEAAGLGRGRRLKLRSVDVEVVRQARATIAAVLRPLAHGDRPERAAVERFNHELSAVLSRRAIDTTAMAWTWRHQGPIEAVLDPIHLDAAELATMPEHARLGHCPSCDWLFYDETRNGRRRWCDMADCGSRAKSRSYYHRSTRPTPGSSSQ